MGDQPLGSSSGDAASKQRTGLRGKVATVLERINKTILGVAGVIAAIGVIGAAVGGLFSHPSPRSPEANVRRATVQPDVALEQFEEEETPSKLNAEDHLTIGAQPGVYLAEASAQTQVGLPFTVYASRRTAVAGARIMISAGAQYQEHAAQGAQQKFEEEAKSDQQKAEQEAKREQLKSEEEAKSALQNAEQEGKQKQAQAVKEAQQSQRNAESEGTAAQLKTEREASHQATENEPGEVRARVEEAKRSSSEQAKVKFEETHPGAIAPLQLTLPALHREHGAEVAVGTAVPAHAVDAVLGSVSAALEATGVSLRPTCLQSCPAVKPTVDKAIADSSSNLPGAAKAVAALFRESRQESVEHKREPVGVAVNYAIHFEGYAGKTLMLEWTLCQKGTRRPLPREWWRNVPAGPIKPTSENVTLPGAFWVPIPQPIGHYYVELRVWDGDAIAGYGETGEFH
jgi:hypothetical protein